MTSKVSENFLSRLRNHLIAKDELCPYVPDERSYDNRHMMAGPSVYSSYEFKITSQTSQTVSQCYRSHSTSSLTPKNPIVKTKLNDRPFKSHPNNEFKSIVIDGSNVAMQHGCRRFSWHGIELCVDDLLRRGHTDIYVVLPKSREGCVRHSMDDFKIMNRLSEAGAIIWAPARQAIDGVRLNPYDDRFIIRSAILKDAIIVSNDQYRDLMHENEVWKNYIKENLLMYTFVGDTIMFPDDPMGFNGPMLNEFLRKTKQIRYSKWDKMR